MRFKIREILWLVFIFILIIFFINIVFASLYYTSNSIVYNSSKSINIGYLDALYFSMISFFTIGYGDISPNIYDVSAKYLLFIQGILGISSISIFSAYLTVKLFKRQGDVVVSKEIALDYRDETYLCFIRIGNIGNDIYDITAKLHFIDSIEEEANEDINITFSKPVLLSKHSWIIPLKIEKFNQFYPYFERAYKYNLNFNMNLILRGIDSFTETEIVLHKKYEIDKIKFGQFEAITDKKKMKRKNINSINKDSKIKDKFLEFVNEGVNFNVTDMQLCSQNNDSESIKKKIIRKDDGEYIEIAIDFNRHEKFDNISGFVSAYFKFDSPLDWEHFYRNKYSLAFNIRSDNNVKIALEIKSNVYPYMIKKEFINPTAEWNEYKIPLMDKKIPKDSFKSITEICFVVTPNDVKQNEVKYYIDKVSLIK